jgi:hypothetical protein
VVESLTELPEMKALPILYQSEDGSIIEYEIAAPLPQPACGTPIKMTLDDVVVKREKDSVSQRIPHSFKSRDRKLQANPTLPYGMTCDLAKESCRLDNNELSPDILSVELKIRSSVVNTDADSNETILELFITSSVPVKDVRDVVLNWKKVLDYDTDVKDELLPLVLDQVSPDYLMNIINTLITQEPEAYSPGAAETRHDLSA